MCLRGRNYEQLTTEWKHLTLADTQTQTKLRQAEKKEGKGEMSIAEKDENRLIKNEKREPSLDRDKGQSISCTE